MSAAAARLEQLRQDVAAERQRTARSTTATGIVGLLVLIALSIYFYIGYRLLDETAQPERIVTVGAQVLDDNLTEVRKSAQAQVATNAPVWAQGLSQQAQAALPTGREKLEDYVMTQVEEALKRGTVLTEDRFRQFLKENSAQIERDLKELSQSPDLAEQSMASLQEAVEKEVGADMMAQSREFRAALSGLIDKLKKYENATNLTSEENNERRILLLARALQQQERVAPERRRGQELPIVAPAPPNPLPRAATSLTEPEGDAAKVQGKSENAP